jgi:hypothetical protein
MLKYGEANPLAVFGLRELDHCPPHFTPVYFDLRSNQKAISDWIWTNLMGRFWYGDFYSKMSDDTTVQLQKCAAFEIPGEASMFALMLDQINQGSYLDF